VIRASQRGAASAIDGFASLLVALAIPCSVVLWQLDSIVASGGGGPATLEVKAALLACSAPACS